MHSASYRVVLLCISQQKKFELQHLLRSPDAKAKVHKN